MDSEEMINMFLKEKKEIIKAEYSQELKVIAYRRENEEPGTRLEERMYDYLEKNSNGNSEEVRRLHGDVKYFKHFPNLQGFFLETFGGYKRI